MLRCCNKLELGITRMPCYGWCIWELQEGTILGSLFVGCPCLERTNNGGIQRVWCRVVGNWCLSWSFFVPVVALALINCWKNWRVLSFNVKYMLVDILLSSRVAIFIEVEVIVVIATSPLYTGITIYLPSWKKNLMPHTVLYIWLILR